MKEKEPISEEKINFFSLNGEKIKGIRTPIDKNKNELTEIDTEKHSIRWKFTSELGSVLYLKGDSFHRENGLPAIYLANGNKEYWYNGLRHRDNGLPAIDLANGNKEYLLNGLRHRDNGLPAIDLANGHKEYWYNGCQFSKETSNLMSFIEQQNEIKQNELRSEINNLKESVNDLKKIILNNINQKIDM